jgi:hypothetical protein
MAGSLLYDLTLRTIIIIALTDAVIFYVMSTRHIKITWQFTISVIAVTLLPLLINIWFVLWKYHLLNVR